MFSGDFSLAAVTRAGARMRWLWPSLRLSQYRTTKGGYEARLLCASDSTIDRALRRVRGGAVTTIAWDREGDLQRCRQRRVAWPIVRIRHFRTARNHLREMDELQEDLDRAISLLIDEERSRLVRPTSVPTSRRSSSYRRQVHHYGLRVSWVESWAPAEVNLAWERVWDALGALCGSRQAMWCKQVYKIPPRKLAQLRLTHVK